MPGRCDGCGKTGSPARISRHILDCPDWQARYAADPATARDPQASYDAWMAGERTAQREERKAQLTARETVLRSAADARWATPKDILED